MHTGRIEPAAGFGRGLIGRWLEEDTIPASQHAFAGVCTIVTDSLQHFFTSIDWACYGVWALTICLMVTGVAGSLIPLVPGPFIVFVAAAVHVLLRPQSGVTWWCVGLLFLLTGLSYVVDFASGAMGTRWFGGSRWGIAGVLVGAIIGVFFALPGIIIGPLLGGFVFEMLFARKEVGPAVKSTWGTLVGTGMGLMLRLIVSLVMVASFFLDAFWL